MFELFVRYVLCVVCVSLRVVCRAHAYIVSVFLVYMPIRVCYMRCGVLCVSCVALCVVDPMIFIYIYIYVYMCIVCCMNVRCVVSV